MKELGLDAPDSIIGGIFDSIDRDRSGAIRFDELSRAGLRAKARRLESNAPMSVRLRKKSELREASANLLAAYVDVDEDALDTIPDQVCENT